MEGPICRILGSNSGITPSPLAVRLRLSDQSTPPQALLPTIAITPEANPYRNTVQAAAASLYGSSLVQAVQTRGGGQKRSLDDFAEPMFNSAA